MSSGTGKSTSASANTHNNAQIDERDQAQGEPIALRTHVAGSETLDRLVETARDYARQAVSDNTLKAYAKDRAQFGRWCRMRGADPLPPSAEMIGLYISDLAAPPGFDGGQGPFAIGDPTPVGCLDRRASVGAVLGLHAARV